MSMHSHAETPGRTLWFGRSLATVRVPSGSGSDRLSVIEMRVPYGESPPMHIHRNQDEVFHILEGQVRFRVGDKTIRAMAGETVLAPKGIAHSFRVESVGGAHWLTITSGTDFEALVHETSLPVPSADFEPFGEPSAKARAALAAAASRNHIEIVGPPLN